MTASNARCKQILGRLENKLIDDIDGLLIRAGMRVFAEWGRAFPKRELLFVSGNGTATFRCPSLEKSIVLLEMDDYCDISTNKTYWDERAFKMLKPIVEFWDLFWCCNLYQYPDIPDISYNPVTKTVECDGRIIEL